MKTPIALLGLLTLTCAPALFAEAPAAAAPAVPESQPCRVVQATRPVFPVVLLHNGITNGSARVSLHVDPAGQVKDLLITGYTHRPFADEAVRVIRKWKFEPAMIKGQPISTILEMDFAFEVNGLVMIERRDPRTATYPEDPAPGLEYQACPLKKLDRIPAPLNVVEPTYPKEWADQGITGRIAVDFYIDEEGKARMPCAVSGNEMLASIAVAAVQQWQFTPPTQKGKPVLVRARQVFNFEPKS